MSVPLPLILTVDDAPCEEEIAAFVAARDDATAFHSLPWCRAITRATGHEFLPLAARDASGAMVGYLPLHHIRSPLFGDALVSTGFAVEGGILADSDAVATALADAAIALAERRKIGSIELRGGRLPAGWVIDETTNEAYAKALAPNRDEQLASTPKRHRAEIRKSLDRSFEFLSTEDSAMRQKILLDIPRKQRAEVRKGLELTLAAAIGSGRVPRRIHYLVYSQSVRNLGTPVFPARLFDEVLDAFGDDADTLTIFKHKRPISSVLTLYWRGTAMPYWGGGISDARALRANERLYFELMDHARKRGMTHFDFGRSKTGSGPAAWKKNWGFEARPLRYARWSAPGRPMRDASAQSPRYAQMIAMWKRLPLWLANTLGPLISRQLG